MSKRTKKVKSAGRFQARYGVLVRKLVRDIEAVQKANHVCPVCGHRTLRRESAGIWRCRKCGAVFSGGAYVPKTDMGKNVERMLKLNEAKSEL